MLSKHGKALYDGEIMKECATNMFAASVQDTHTLKSQIDLHFHAMLQLHNLPVDCARMLIKRLGLASLLVCNEKNL